jgi:hypothetical protein
MEQIKSLLGGYNPASDQLAAEFRSRVASNLTAFTDTSKLGDQTKDILSKIPGVSDETKGKLDEVLSKAKGFSEDAMNKTPGEISAAKDKLDLAVKTLVQKAQDEAKSVKQQQEAAKVEAAKEAKENKVFSVSRLGKRMWDTSKWYLLVLGVVLIAVWGGSMASNAAIDKPWYLRLFYLVYGSVLFPISFIFAIWRKVTGKAGPNYAILAPLIPLPTSNAYLQYGLFPFTYLPPNVVMPLPVEPAADPIHVPESYVVRNNNNNNNNAELEQQV